MFALRILYRALIFDAILEYISTGSSSRSRIIGFFAILRGNSSYDRAEYVIGLLYVYTPRKIPSCVFNSSTWHDGQCFFNIICADHYGIVPASIGFSKLANIPIAVVLTDSSNCPTEVPDNSSLHNVNADCVNS